MKRLRRFWRNADIRGSGAIRWILLAVGLGFFCYQAIGSGSWVYSFPLLVAAFVFTYLMRNWLVDHLAGVRTVMNALLIVAVIASLIPGLRALDAPWLNALVIGLLGTYLGCYFWLLSDERIEVLRPGRRP